MANSNQAVRDLLTYPKAFLENNGLMIFSGGGPSKQQDFRMVLKNDQWNSITGESSRMVPVWALYFDGSFFANAKPGETPSDPVPAQYLAMTGRDEAAWGTGAAGFVLPGTGGPDLMLTSKINGCTFGVGSDANGARLVTHLQPMAGMGQSDANLTGLSNAVDQTFAQSGGSLIAKATSTGEFNGTVVGTRTGGSWKFFIQRFRADLKPYRLESVAVIS